MDEQTSVMDGFQGTDILACIDTKRQRTKIKPSQNHTSRSDLFRGALLGFKDKRDCGRRDQ